ncbi:FAD-binding oxidoreductase [Rubrimonas cliftonensis]|uniref:D-lactate dehydrogenase (cytochrome) n=1 Tax=Rubrimonas cliftonensis TaxID=89524 RepID=A0A1H4F6L4_9RHOB|nr:FAD-linked oxidase C-terminal domain-containing protein [Rubrimonas cliftonensis]SEA92933.1 D-lactate dehydrogenase (cytochrome) [Rubrimonas cliftonensis]
MALDAADPLRALLGARFVEGEAVRAQHGRDEAHHAPHMPDAVCFPDSAQETAEILRLCAASRTPVTPFGAGTSLEGQVVPVRGGVSLDMSRMNRILAVNAEDLDAVVQPGLTRMALNAHLRDAGLFFSVDPGADASLGGMASTRASGTNAVRYGTMRENVLALQVALADGRLIRTGTRARKSSAGYDLTKLFIGAEGTLGVITELTVRLWGQPECVVAAVCPFPDIAAAVNATILTIQMGVPVARIELLDEVQIRGFNAHAGYAMAETPTLFVEFHGAEAGVAEQVARFREIAEDHGALGFEQAAQAEDRNRLWAARHNAYYAAKGLRPGAQGYVTDACVPISKLAEAILETKADLAQSPLIAPLVGHVGDGNFHLAILIDPADAAEKAEAERLAHRIAERAIRLGGTCTGEHGVGLGKRRYMSAEHGEGWAVMGEIKRALDPLGLLNPGKLTPDA